MHTCWQGLLTGPRQRRGSASVYHVRRDRQIELMDEPSFQSRAKKRWSAFACKPADIVFTAQCFQHGRKVDLARFSEMQRGLRFERGLSFLWHALRGKNEDRRNPGLENIQSAGDPAFVGDDYAQWGWGFLSVDSRLL